MSFLGNPMKMALTSFLAYLQPKLQFCEPNPNYHNGSCNSKYFCQFYRILSNITYWTKSTNPEERVNYIWINENQNKNVGWRLNAIVSTDNYVNHFKWLKDENKLRKNCSRLTVEQPRSLIYGWNVTMQKSKIKIG